MTNYYDKLYVKMRNDKRKRISILFYKTFSYDISNIISKYIADISIEEWENQQEENCCTLISIMSKY